MNAVANGSPPDSERGFRHPVAGPPLAGVVLVLSSEAICFALNGRSFVTIMLVLCRLRRATQRPSSASFKAALAEGLAFIRHSFPVRHILLQVARLNFLAANYIPLMPAFAREVFGGGPNTLGGLLGSAGAGAFSASLRLAAGPGVRGLSGSITDGVLVAALALVAFALANGVWLAGAMLFILGFGIIIRRRLEWFCMHLPPISARLGI